MDTSLSTTEILRIIETLPNIVETIPTILVTEIQNIQNILKLPETQQLIQETSFTNILDILFEYTKTTLCIDSITITNITSIATSLLHIVEGYKILTGCQKKQAILDTIKRFINENITDSQDHNILLIITNSTLPYFIDTLVSAINGNVKFNKKQHKLAFTSPFQLPSWIRILRMC